MAKIEHSEYFGAFAKSLEKEIDNREDGSKQEDQVNGLIDLERRFRKAIIRFGAGRQAYIKFVNLIKKERKNILDARPFFRERQEVFSGKITPAIKANKPEDLYVFDVNFIFIKFVIESWDEDIPPKVLQLYEKVKYARETLIINNLPLAINRAKLFFKKTPKAHLEYMDMIQIASDGLIIAVDKYCGPYTKVFRSVGIGRMTGNMIDSYSDTVIHIYPSLKRILYKANSISNREKITDLHDLYNKVQESFKEDVKNGKSKPKHVSEQEFVDLMSASTVISSTVETEIGTVVDMCDMLSEDFYHIIPSTEEIVEQKQAMDTMSDEIRELTMMEKKVLKMKGVSI